MAGHATANAKNVTLYATTNFADLAPSFAEMVANGKLVVDGNKVPCARNADNLEAAGNVASYRCLGEDTQRTIAGAQSFGEWGFDYNADETDGHGSMLGDLNVGDAIQVGILIKTGDNNQTIKYVRGSVASNSDLGFNDDTPITKRLTVAMSQKPLKRNKA